MKTSTTIRRGRTPVPAAAIALLALSSMGIALFGLPDPGGPVETPGSGRSGAMESLEFWSAARAYPEAQIASDKHYRAFEANRGAFKHEPSLSGSAGGWSYIGPSNLSGRMLAIAVNPLNTGTIYAGSASGGLWRSRTGGVAGDWERVSTGFPVLGVGAIAIDPTDTSVMYIGTGEVYRYGGTAGGLMLRTTRGSYGMGILKSTDAGATWSKSLDWSYNQERGVQHLLINPERPTSVWAATTEGVYRSHDAGATWTDLLPIPMAQSIVMHGSDTSRLLVSVGNLGLAPGIYRTTDGGANWNEIGPIGFTGKTLLARFEGNDATVYASIADSTTGVGALWRTDDFGTNWIELSDNTTNNIFGVQGWYSHFVAVHPSDSTQVFHAGVPASKSTNGGTTFSGAGGTYSDHHGYAFDPVTPEILYVANDDGIYRSTNFGANFTQVSDNLGTGQFYNGFSNSASDSLIALGQVQDHIPGYLYNGSDFWPESAADEVGWTAIDQSNDFIMYCVTRDGGSVRKSTNRGVSWFNSSSGLSGVACWNSPLVISTSNPSVLYLGRARIFRTTNSGSSWTATNGGAVLDGNPALSMGISATSPDTLYAGTAPRTSRARVFSTVNGGTSWTDVTGPLPDRYPLDIGVDPNDSRTVYVGFGGYNTGHIFKSTDAGGSWLDITGSLPDIPVTAVMVDPLNSSHVYIGTDIGVYISTDGGASWNSFGDGLPEAILISDLSMTPSNRTIRATSHGNSVWERPMPSVFPSVSLLAPAGGELWKVNDVELIEWDQALVASVDIDYSTDNGSTWTTVVSGVPGHPGQYAWTVPPTLTTTAKVRVRSAGDTTLASATPGTFEIWYDGVIAEADWNMLSVPSIAPDYSRAAVFPGSVGLAYLYDAAYLSVETLENGRGYWIKYDAPTAVPIGGDSITTDTIAVAAGWNLLGSLTGPVSVAAIVEEPGGSLTTPFYGYDGAYDLADTLLPGRAYWVKSGGAADLIMTTAGAVPASAAARREPESAGTVTFIDASGRMATILCATGDAARSASGRGAYELPPLPPGNGFDVRLANGSRYYIPGQDAGAIRIQGAKLPLTVRWNFDALPGDGGADAGNGGAAAGLVFNSGSTRIELTGSGSAELATAAGLALSPLGSGAGIRIPTGHSLSQNYPNPFNPSTTIRFAVAGPAGGTGTGDAAGAPGSLEARAVTIEVFDVSGGLVATLVDGPLPPGEHTAVWNAAGHPSGIYYCRMNVADATLVKPMLLVR